VASERPISIDPEVEEILRLIGADRGSALLRVPRPQNIRGLLERTPRVSVGAAMLTVAERHLLQVHRNEVARLLVEAGKTLLIDGPRRRVKVSPYQTARREHLRLEPGDLARQMQKIRPSRTIEDNLDHPWKLLEECVRHPFGLAPTVTQLAEASLRLQPSDEARIEAGLDLIHLGAPEASVRILHDVLQAPASASIWASAENNLGVAFAYLGEMEKAHHHHVSACEVGEDVLEPWMNRLIFAIQLGLVDDARLAAESIDSLASETHPLVVSVAKRQEVDRLSGVWFPTGVSHESIRQLESRLGPASRRIIAGFGPVTSSGAIITKSNKFPMTHKGTGTLPKRVSTRPYRLVS